MTLTEPLADPLPVLFRSWIGSVLHFEDPRALFKYLVPVAAAKEDHASPCARSTTSTGFLSSAYTVARTFPLTTKRTSCVWDACRGAFKWMWGCNTLPASYHHAPTCWKSVSDEMKLSPGSQSSARTTIASSAVPCDILCVFIVCAFHALSFQNHGLCHHDPFAPCHSGPFASGHPSLGVTLSLSKGLPRPQGMFHEASTPWPG
jgi:hypothetical protein